MLFRSTGPAGFRLLREPLGLLLRGAVVPPLGPVLPVLRDSVPNGQISQGTYLNVLSSQWFSNLFAHFAQLTHSLSSIVANL